VRGDDVGGGMGSELRYLLARGGQLLGVDLELAFRQAGQDGPCGDWLASEQTWRLRTEC